MVTLHLLGVTVSVLPVKSHYNKLPSRGSLRNFLELDGSQFVSMMAICVAYKGEQNTDTAIHHQSKMGAKVE